MGEFNNIPEVKKIVTNYKINYLDKLTESELCTKDNIDFISKFPFLIKSDETFFALLYKQSEKVDKLMDYEGFSERYVNYIIQKEEIDAKIWKDEKPVTQKPDWKDISARISRRYGDKYAIALVPQSQLMFFKRIGNWGEYIGLKEAQIKKIPKAGGNGCK